MISCIPQGQHFTISKNAVLPNYEELRAPIKGELSG